MKQKRIAIAGVSAAMLVGAGTGIVLNLPNGAGASGAPTVASSGTGDTTATTTATTTPGADAPKPTRPRGQFGLQAELAKLVAAGTITQAQADAITAALKAAVPAVPSTGGPGAGGPGGGRGGRGPGFGGPGFGGRGGFGGFGGAFGGGKVLDTAATALGITTDALLTDLKAGKTIADVAKAQGVDVQKVIDAIVAEETANVKERVTNMVNGVKPVKPAPPATTDAPATTAATATTGG